MMVKISPVAIDKGAVLVVQRESLDDLADLIRREHDQRVADLIQQAGMCEYWTRVRWWLCLVMTM
jgi:hypothetical protein